VTKFGYFLSSEEWRPQALVKQAQAAEQAGFEALWISDHYHPWNDAQGQSAFVWSVIGALSQVTTLPVTTAVTCPTIRIHPAVVAQAAATSAVMFDGRFILGVGSGEALNEHILGDAWPSADIRLEMLEEAIDVLRKLFEGGFADHRGTHYHVENARLYTLPSTPPPIYMSAFGPKAVQLAARVADGLISTMPDAELVSNFRESGGGDKPAQAGYKVCYGTDEAAARATAHRLWANAAVPGELSQVLPSPRHFEQASTLVTEDMVAEEILCGDDVAAHVERLQSFIDAGYDEVYVNQIGPEQDAFFDFFAKRVLPEVR